MADRFDRLLIGAGCRFHAWLDWLQGRVFAAVDDASFRVMQRSWQRQRDRTRR